MVDAGADWLNRSPRGKLLITGSNPVLTTNAVRVGSFTEVMVRQEGSIPS